MRRILFVLSLIMVFLIAGCSDQGEYQQPTASSEDDQEQITESPVQENNVDDEPITQTQESSDFDWDTSQETTTPEGCYDSDGGSFDKIKGFIIDSNNERFEDNCVNSFSVKEYYCGITGYKSDKIITCKFKCEDGICVEGEADKECVDSDYYDEFNKGTVSYKGEVKTDYCDNDKILIEQVCSSVDIATTKDIVCDSGCNDGRCNPVVDVEETEDCIDPDQGPDQGFTKTTVVDKKGSFTDECLNQYEVKEYYCNSYGFNANKNIRCDNGCEDGACVE